MLCPWRAVPWPQVSLQLSKRVRKGANCGAMCDALYRKPRLFRACPRCFCRTQSPLTHVAPLHIQGQTPSTTHPVLAKPSLTPTVCL